MQPPKQIKIVLRPLPDSLDYGIFITKKDGFNEEAWGVKAVGSWEISEEIVVKVSIPWTSIRYITETIS